MTAKKPTTPSRVARKNAARAKLAAYENVPGFPEIIGWSSRCRICKLVEDEPDLLHEIHQMWTSGRGVRALETATAVHWKRRDEKTVDHRCFDRHFKGHVRFAALDPVRPANFPALPAIPAMTEAVLPPPVINVKALSPAAANRTGALHLRRPGVDDDEQASDYFDMRQIIERLRARMSEVDEKAVFLTDEGAVNHYSIVMWLRLVAELRQAIEAVNRMKNSDRLTKSILQAHTKRMVQMLSEPLVARFQTVLAQLEEDSSNGAELLEQLLSGEVTSLVLRAAEESVKESCDVYRLQ